MYWPWVEKDGEQLRVRLVPLTTAEGLTVPAVLASLQALGSAASPTSATPPILSPLGSIWALQVTIVQAREKGELDWFAGVADHPTWRRALAGLLVQIQRSGIGWQKLATEWSQPDSKELARLLQMAAARFATPWQIAWQLVELLRDGHVLPQALADVSRLAVDCRHLEPGIWERELVEAALSRGWSAEVFLSMPPASAGLQENVSLWSLNAPWLQGLQARFAGRLVLTYPRALPRAPTDTALRMLQDCWPEIPTELPCDGTVKLIAAASGLLEANWIARDVARRAERKPGSTMAIAVRDAASYLPLLADQLDRLRITWESNLALPFARSPVCRHARAVIEAAKENWPLEQLLQVLGSPFFPPAVLSNVSLARMKRFLHHVRYVDDKVSPIHLLPQRWQRIEKLGGSHAVQAAEEVDSFCRALVEVLPNVQRPGGVQTALHAPVSAEDICRVLDKLTKPIRAVCDSGCSAIVVTLEREWAILRQAIETAGRAWQACGLAGGTWEQWVEYFQELHGLAHPCAQTRPREQGPVVRVVGLAEAVSLEPEVLYAPGWHDRYGHGVDAWGNPAPDHAVALLSAATREQLSALADSSWGADRLEAEERARWAGLLAPSECLVLTAPVAEDADREFGPGELFFVLKTALKEPEEPAPEERTLCPAAVRGVQFTHTYSRLVPPLPDCRTEDEFQARLALVTTQPGNVVAGAVPDGWQSVDLQSERQLSIEKLREHWSDPATQRWLRGAAIERCRDEALRRKHPSPWMGHLGSAARLQMLREKEVQDAYAIDSREPQEYARCPFRYLVARLLQEHWLEDAEGGRRKRFGALIHRILQCYGARVSQLERHDWEHLEQLARACFDEFWQGAFWGGDFWRVREWEWVVARLRRALELAKQDEDQWRIRHVELGLDDVVIRLDDTRKLRLSARIDRIDVAANGDALRIVDYKTGRKRNGLDKLFAQGIEQQVYLYRLALATAWKEGTRLRDRLGLPSDWPTIESRIRGQYVYLHEGEVQEIAYSAGDDERIREHLCKLHEGLSAGRFPVEPASPDECRRCFFGAVCRIDQHRPGGAGDAAQAGASAGEIEGSS